MAKAISVDSPIDELLGVAARCAEQLDEHKLLLGAVTCALAERYGNWRRAVDDVASVVRTQLTRATVARYGHIVRAFPDATALLARYAHIGLGTLDLARQLPPEARQAFIEQVSTDALSLARQRTLARRLRASNDYSRDNVRRVAEQLLSEIVLRATLTVCEQGALLTVAQDDLSALRALDGAQVNVVLRPIGEKARSEAEA